MVNDLECSCTGIFWHTDEQDNQDGTITDTYQCDNCLVWRFVTWKKGTEEIIKIEQKQDEEKEEK